MDNFRVCQAVLNIKNQGGYITILLLFHQLAFIKLDFFDKTFANL